MTKRTRELRDKKMRTKTTMVQNVTKKITGLKIAKNTTGLKSNKRTNGGNVKKY